MNTLMQIMITFTYIITNKGQLLDEEWSIVFDVVREIVQDKAFRNQPVVLAHLKGLFAEIRGLYLAGLYNGTLPVLLDAYLVVRHMINDRLFDTIYLNSLRHLDAPAFESKLNSFLDIDTLPELAAKIELPSFDPQARTRQLLTAFSDFYHSVPDPAQQQILESVFIGKIYKLLALRLPADLRLQAMRIMQRIAMHTINDEHFEMVVISFRKDIVATPPAEGKEAAISDEALQNLFVLFHRCYLNYPPTRLAFVVRNFLLALKGTRKESTLIILRFLANLSYNRNRNMYLVPWKVPSYLTISGPARESLPPQNVVSAVAEFLQPGIDQQVVLGALDVLIANFRSHYGLYQTSLSKFIDDIIKFEKYVIQQNDMDVALKIVELNKLIMAQRSAQAETDTGKEGQQSLQLVLADVLPIFGDFLSVLGTLAETYRGLAENSRLRQRARGSSLAHGTFCIVRPNSAERTAKAGEDGAEKGSATYQGDHERGESGAVHFQGGDPHPRQRPDKSARNLLVGCGADGKVCRRCAGGHRQSLLLALRASDHHREHRQRARHMSAHRLAQPRLPARGRPSLSSGLFKERPEGGATSPL